MNQYLLLNRIQVQNANAVSGFTWGFPAVTHFLGFTHNLQLKLTNHDIYKEFQLHGCAVIAHKHTVHRYKTSGGINFSQFKRPHYQIGSNLAKDPSVIEEAKMNMTVSLVIELDGYIGNRQADFERWIDTACKLQRLAGGMILDIQSIQVIGIDESNLSSLRRKLLPGFLLQDRSAYLAEHMKNLRKSDPRAELIEAWFDFCSLKQKARPRSDLIEKHLQKHYDANTSNLPAAQLLNDWHTHKDHPYEPKKIPESLQTYFDAIDSNADETQEVKVQWQNYCNPTDETDADWEYVKKPQLGYLVPIMTGYKAITEVYKNKDVSGTRDNETDVCFVEAVHSIGEWQSAHRLRTTEELARSFWHYAPHKKPWYLCEQPARKKESDNDLD